MNTHNQAGKRIVSREEYIEKQSKRAALFLLGAVVYPFALMGLTLLTNEVVRNDTSLSGLTFVLVFAFVTGFMLLMNKVTDYFSREISSIEPGVPITRANMAHLHASDCLVRASSEPAQEQQATLLRAAISHVETSVTQLLRPACGMRPAPKHRTTCAVTRPRLPYKVSSRSNRRVPRRATERSAGRPANKRFIRQASVYGNGVSGL